jgi:hypothetical protein
MGAVLTISRKVYRITDDSLFCALVKTVLKIKYTALAIDESFSLVKITKT